MVKRTLAGTGRDEDRSVVRVGGLAVLASFSSFFYYFQRGEILMHGDATAHINIARRAFDSLTPGPLQLGRVWLPLPHLLMMPFLVPDKLWQTGVGGSIPSMIAYVLGVLGIFRLVGGLLEANARTQPSARVGAGLAALAYGANPNLIYVQTTALTETLYLAFFIWTLVYFAEFLRELGGDEKATNSARTSLRRCACCVGCAEMTRYDGWFLAGVIGVIVAVFVVRRWEDRALRRMAAIFLPAMVVVPALWLIYNAAVYGNALDFSNGPYSARAIEMRVGAPNPAFHNFGLGALYFLKSAQITLAVGNWGRWWLLAAAVAGLLGVRILRGRGLTVLLVLWSPVAFYAYALAYGSVPLHVPLWWPFAVFNQRFGLELLPMFAVSAGWLASLIWASWPRVTLWKPTVAAGVLMVASYAFVLKSGPLDLVEASRNWAMRRGLDGSVERVLKMLPSDSIYLMDLAEHVSIMERLGIPLRRIVNSENHRVWKQPTDPEGIWERALADPAGYVNYVIAFEGDAVDRGVNRTGLNLLAVIHGTGQPTARIYETARPVNQSR